MSNSSAERSAALERLFQAAEKQSKGFVPFPEHLRSLDSRSAFSSSLAQHQAQTHQQLKQQQQQNQKDSDSGNGKNHQQHQTTHTSDEQQQQQKISTYNFCASRVPHLSGNLERATSALEAAHEAEEEVQSMLSRVDKMIDVTKTVRDYSERMSTNASALIAKRARVEGILNGVSDRLKKFQKIDSLHDEAIASTKYVANTSRFVSMLDEIEDSAAFLADVSHFKQSAQVYSTRLSIAYQRSMSALRDHCCDALRDSSNKVKASALMKRLLLKPAATTNTATTVTPSTAATTTTEKQTNDKDNATSEQQQQTNEKSSTAVNSENGTTNSSSSASTFAVSSTSTAQLPPPFPSRPEKLSDALKLVDDEFASTLSSSETAFRLIEARIGAKEAEQFVSDVFSSYAEARLQIVEPLLVEYSSANAASASASSPSSSSSSSSFNVTNFVHNMIAACVSEAALFQTIWISDLSSSFLRGPLESLVSAGYEVFRSKVLALDAVGQLCSLSYTLVDIQKKLHQQGNQQQQIANKNMATRRQYQQHDESTNSSNAMNNNNNNKVSIVNSVALRNELISSVVSRFIQDTDERLMFRVSIYLRNGLCAPSHIIVSATADKDIKQQQQQQQVPISDWIFDRAAEALTKKVFNVVPPASSSTTTLKDASQQQKEHEKFGAPQSLDIPTPFSVPFAIGPVVRLRWLCAQLKRSASGASTFAVFLEEATNAVISQVNGLLNSSWRSRGSTLNVSNFIGTETNSESEDDKKQKTKEATVAVSAALTSLLPFALALRQLLLTREALLSIGSRLAVSESSFTFTTMQISKIELEVPRAVEEPFRAISEEAIRKLAEALVSFHHHHHHHTNDKNDSSTPPPTTSSGDTSENTSSADANKNNIFKAFTCCLQLCFDHSVATQQLIWRGAVPVAVGMIKNIESEEEKDKLKNIWNALL